MRAKKHSIYASVLVKSRIQATNLIDIVSPKKHQLFNSNPTQKISIYTSDDKFIILFKITIRVTKKWSSILVSVLGA